MLEFCQKIAINLFRSFAVLVWRDRYAPRTARRVKTPQAVWPSSRGHGARTCARGSQRREAKILESHLATQSCKLSSVRSRLYQSQILRVIMRLKALAEIYTMHSFAQLCNLIFFVKILLIVLAKFCENLIQKI